MQIISQIVYWKPWNLNHKHSQKISSKMLKTTKRVMIWTGILPADKSATTGMKIAYIVFTFVVFVSTLSGFIAFSTYVVQFWSTDFVGCLHTSMCIGCGFSTIYIMIIALFSRNKMASIFKHLSDIYKAGMCFVRQKKSTIYFKLN